VLRVHLIRRRGREYDSRVRHDVDAERDAREAEVELDLAREVGFGRLGFRGFDARDGWRFWEVRLWFESGDDPWWVACE
jgi:hypothetical protein